MAQCPVCLAGVSDDFGLIECGSCGVQLIVHMDGRVEAAHPAPASEEAAAPSDFAGGDIPEQALNPLEMPSDPHSDYSSTEGDDSPPVSDEAEFGAEPEMEPQPEVEAQPDREALPEVEAEAHIDTQAVDPLAEEVPDFLADEPSALSSQTEEVYNGASGDSPDLSDIAQFGNSENSVRDGSLRYRLYVQGIDTADVREAFREALTDRKFMWDTDQILRSIRSGQTRIDNVTASKAHMLISRLRGLPIRVTWEQYVVHQS